MFGDRGNACDSQWAHRFLFDVDPLPQETEETGRMQKWKGVSNWKNGLLISQLQSKERTAGTQVASISKCYEKVIRHLKLVAIGQISGDEIRIDEAVDLRQCSSDVS